MNYRKEIDGLRAVAVVPVIFFHAGFELFSGGFVGVDVFFVISGYLITTIILSEMDRGAFSLVNFYERRTRRILPALFLVMFICLPFAWLWLLPSDMVDFSQSLVAVSTFSSNMYFWQTSGYWGIENELIPLLHTWSLAVEEQYYLLFPVFLMLMWRFSKLWITSVFAAFAVASFVLAQWGAYHHPTANFFLLITRGWELAIGAVIAVYFLYRKSAMGAFVSHRWVEEVLSLVGLLMIAYAVFAFDKTVPFPSLYALVPTVGTGLIILFSSPSTIIGRLLGLKPFVRIGLISYSAYLWHQPLFAFARYRSSVSPSMPFFLALSLLSMLLAYGSWRYFEKPFRQKDSISRKTVFVCAGLGSLFFIAIGLAGQFYGGWPGRIDKALQVSIEDARLQNIGRELCLETGSRYGANEASCTLVRGTNKFAFLMGDSHAIALTGAMKNAFEQKNIGLIRATERGCPPVQGVYVYESEADKQRCFKHNQEVYRYLEKNPDIEYVILAARWALYTEGKRFDNKEGGVEHSENLYFDVQVNEKSGFSSLPNSQEGFKQAYTASVERLLSMGKKVILVYPIPEAGWNVPRYITGSYLSNGSEAFSLKTGSTSHKVFQNRNANVYEALDRIGAHPNLFRVFPEKLFCNNGLKHRCIVQENKKILYGDDDHLSITGARLITEEIMMYLD